MTIHRTIGPLKKLFATNVAPASLTLKAPTRTAPTGDGVIDCRESADSLALSTLKLWPFGTGANNTTLTIRVTIWHEAQSSAGALVEYVPTRLGDFLCTLGANVGALSGTGTSTRYADTITAVATPPAAATTYEILSPADDGTAMLKIDFAGARFVQIEIGTVGTATDGNCWAGQF
jgi:hypothetical protein